MYEDIHAMEYHGYLCQQNFLYQYCPILEENCNHVSKLNDLILPQYRAKQTTKKVHRLKKNKRSDGSAFRAAIYAIIESAGNIVIGEAIQYMLPNPSSVYILYMRKKNYINLRILSISIYSHSITACRFESQINHQSSLNYPKQLIII